jgi:predicted transcriptional regulator
MPYDSNLDAQIFTRFWENDSGKIVVSVYSYNNGPRKIQIVREVKDRNGEYAFAKLGRLTKEEAGGVLPLIQEALKNMQ